MQHYGGGVSEPGGGVIRPTSWSSSTGFVGSHPPLEPTQLNHLFLLSSAVLKWNRSNTGASRGLSAVERDGASASALDRWIGRDVPAHLHPTRDRRGAAEAGLPGRRKKYFNGVVMQRKGSSKTVMSNPCQHIFDLFIYLLLFTRS